MGRNVRTSSSSWRTIGWGDLECYGHPHLRTPNLDRLASQGTRFSQFYVNSAVCSPSRAAFLTGTFPAHYRIHSALATPTINERNGSANFLDPEATCLPRVLQAAGYATAHFGKWHLGSGARDPNPSAYGFDEHRTSWANNSDPYFWSSTTQFMVDDAIRFIQENRNRSFYVNLWTLIPHATLNPTPREMSTYREFGPPDVPHKGAHQIYYGAVTGLDEQVGRLLAKLTELGLDEKTLVLFRVITVRKTSTSTARIIAGSVPLGRFGGDREACMRVGSVYRCWCAGPAGCLWVA